MEIKVSARHGSLSQVTQDKVKAKVEKITRLFDRLTEIIVAINLENREQIMVDLRVSAEHKHDFVASQQGDELMGALDGAVHKVEQQIRKYKEKLQKHKGGEGISQEVLTEASELD